MPDTENRFYLFSVIRISFIKPEPDFTLACILRDLSHLQFKRRLFPANRQSAQGRAIQLSVRSLLRSQFHPVVRVFSRLK